MKSEETGNFFDQGSLFIRNCKMRGGEYFDKNLIRCERRYLRRSWLPLLLPFITDPIFGRRAQKKSTNGFENFCWLNVFSSICQAVLSFILNAYICIHIKTYWPAGGGRGQNPENTAQGHSGHNSICPKGGYMSQGRLT